jgi:hypothetical protein
MSGANVEPEHPRPAAANEVRWVLEVLARLDADVRVRTQVDISVEGTFGNVLKGCFSKAYEFVRLAHEDLRPSAAFFIAPTLRGICEDFIALKYLHQKRTPSERDNILMAKAMNQLATAVEKQVAFFKHVRPHQPVVALDPTPQFPAVNLPPARNMATEVGLDDLYDFVYAITSDVVHFNPRIIIRNAWGDHPKFSHSTSNFDPYYRAFCRIYGVYFLCLFSVAFAKEIGLSTESLRLIAELETALNDEIRWPEAVTYEEMNLAPPSYVTRVLLKSAHHIDAGQSSATTATKKDKDAD